MFFLGWKKERTKLKTRVPIKSEDKPGFFLSIDEKRGRERRKKKQIITKHNIKKNKNEKIFMTFFAFSNLLFVVSNKTNS